MQKGGKQTQNEKKNNKYYKWWFSNRISLNALKIRVVTKLQNTEQSSNPQLVIYKK